MTAKQLIASVSLLLAAGVAGTAFAAPADLNFPKLQAAPGSSQQTGLTRAEVHADVLRARAAGELEFSEVNYPPVVAVSTGLTREQVKAEVIAARANGELDINETNYPSFFDGRAQRAAATMTAAAKRSAASASAH